jgi:hypothetical protein
MFAGWTHRWRGTAGAAIAIAVLGVGAFVSTGSAQPGSGATSAGGEAALATHALQARYGTATPARLAAAAPAAHILGQFIGKTGLPAIATLSRNRKTLRIAIGFNMSCNPSGNKFNSNDNWDKLSIGKNGAVHAFATFRAIGSLQGGTDTLTGKFDRKHDTFTGTWDMHLIFSVQNAQGAQSTDQCDSGAVRFKLSN